MSPTELTLRRARSCKNFFTNIKKCNTMNGIMGAFIQMDPYCTSVNSDTQDIVIRFLLFNLKAGK